MPESKVFGMPRSAAAGKSRWAIHYHSRQKNPVQIFSELERDGIGVLDSADKKLVSRDPFGRVCFDRVMLIEVSSRDDDKLYFPERDQPQGRYREWPYCLDAYQYALFYVPGATLRDDAVAYTRRVEAYTRFRVPPVVQRLLPAV